MRIDMSTYINKHTAVVAMLKEAMDMHGYNITDLEEKIGITRSQLYRWINGDAKNIQQKSFQAVAHNLGYVITNTDDGIEVNRQKQTQGDTMESYTVEAQRKTIRLQEEKIELLEQKIALYESNKTTNSNDREPEPPDNYHCIIEYKLFVSKEGVGRQVRHFEGFQQCREWLGYTKPEWMEILELDQVKAGIMQSKLSCLYTEKELTEAVQAEESMRLLYKNIHNTTTTWSCSDKVKMFVDKDKNFVPLRIFDNIHWPTMTRKQYWVFINGEDVV